MSLLKVKFLDRLKVTVKVTDQSKIKKKSNYKLKKMKLLMMWLVYVFGVLSVCFYTIFSIFSGNCLLKNPMILYMKLLPRNVYYQIIKLYLGTMESGHHGSYIHTCHIVIHMKIWVMVCTKILGLDPITSKKYIGPKLLDYYLEKPDQWNNFYCYTFFIKLHF